MPLLLRIENMDTLPDGGPVRYELDRRGLDIGRDPYLDWTLPDPERFISGKHCEIRYRDGGYWLHDVSTNGTSVNGRGGRLTEPHRLQDGDRIHIGQYIIAVELSGASAVAVAKAPLGGLLYVTPKQAGRHSLILKNLSDKEIKVLVTARRKEASAKRE